MTWIPREPACESWQLPRGLCATGRECREARNSQIAAERRWEAALAEAEERRDPREIRDRERLKQYCSDAGLDMAEFLPEPEVTRLADRADRVGLTRAEWSGADPEIKWRWRYRRGLEDPSARWSAMFRDELVEWAAARREAAELGDATRTRVDTLRELANAYYVGALRTPIGDEEAAAMTRRANLLDTVLWKQAALGDALTRKDDDG